LIELPALREDGAVNVVVESPRGSSAKFKYDPQDGVFVLSRPLPSGLVYPHDWGFIPSTRTADGDPLDAMVLWEGVSYPGVVIPCRLIGVLQVEQNRKSSPGRERNDRVLAQPVRSTALESIKSVSDVDPSVRAQLERFFEHAVAFERKDLRFLGWGGPAQADALLKASLKEVPEK
jgi:inorganic pyrophosphatase